MERLKNMELKKTFLVLSASCVLVALLMAIVEAAIISIVACLLATTIPLRSIARMSIVDSIETVE